MRRGGIEMEKTETSAGKTEGKVMNTRAKNGQKLQKRNEKPANGKKKGRMRGNGTSCHRDVVVKSDAEDAERSIWREKYITVRDEGKQMGRRRQTKGQRRKKETLDKTSSIENPILIRHSNTPSPFPFQTVFCLLCRCYQI